MPSKRPSPLEDPPSASSSSGESEEETMAEREEDESEEESEEEDEEEELKQTQTSIAKPTPKKSVSTATSKPSSDDDSDTESGSDSEPSPEKPKLSRGADPSVKPISSKPMSGNAKPKKSSSSGATASAVASTPVKAASSAQKRALEADKTEKETAQKKKKKAKSGDPQAEDGHVEESEKKQGSQGEDQKKLFQRVWSEEDEIVILKGMLSFMKRDLNPTTNLDAFLDSIKGSLQADVNKAQLHSKLQRLKQKYTNQGNRAKNGKDPNFTKPNDLKVYQLSKKIWGRKGDNEDGTEVNNGGRDSVATDGKKSKGGKTGNGVASSQTKGVAMLESHRGNVENEDEERPNSLIQFGKGLTAPPPFFGDFLAKEGLGLIGSSKSKEFEQKWQKLIVDETKMYLRRLDLLREHTKSLLDALEHSNS
ncbi:hypothetical protein Syun_000477 [Stephania yunnanensis]|uniref:Glabrous enhancer-binding protein-like DBD domain-containing protein n=1 Tax=Stephania yunnanensis TaxID=152371 RepID=A0AAP0Q5D2_9MAGN